MNKPTAPTPPHVTSTSVGVVLREGVTFTPYGTNSRGVITHRHKDVLTWRYPQWKDAYRGTVGELETIIGL